MKAYSITTTLASASLACGALFGVPAAHGQDLYDTATLRTFAFQFNDANWLALLRANYTSQTNILATLTVDGVSYPNVGVRLRGNSSYTSLPSGSEKFSLNVEMDAVDPEQELMGYGSLNLNNGFHDPTFCREVLYNNYVAQYMPNPRANHALVTLNGQNWGVYINVQQFNKTMLSSHFADTSGLRIKCANTPNGPGLRYNGATSSGYTGYEIKDMGGLTDPWAAHIAVCNALTNGVAANWRTTVDPIFAIDPSIWSVVFENVLTDDDSYVNKGADFMTYRNPTDGRTYLLQTDANETFTQVAWSPILNFSATTKPFLNRIVAVPELRQRYMAHYRTVKNDLNWAYFEPKANQLRNLIDPHVSADPKKLYSYALFTSNFTSQVTLPYSGPAGGTVPGIQQFLTTRTTNLNANAEVSAIAPVISNVTISDSTPDPSTVVTIGATVTTGGGFGIARVDLYYRIGSTGTYERLQMTAMGGGLYRTNLPVAGQPGTRISYYVGATSTNSYASQTFSPAHTEWDPLRLEYTFGTVGGMRFTEYMYSGAGGEFVEMTNFSDSTVDMTGYSFDDDRAIAGNFSLSAFGTVQPGESVIVCESAAETFRTAWGISPSVKIIGNLGNTAGGNNLARNDELNLFASGGAVVDRLTYGDQTFTGTLRAQNASGQPTHASIGQNDVTLWQKSVLADLFGSWRSTGNDLGTPGYYPPTGCDCAADFNCDGGVDGSDVESFFTSWAASEANADVNEDGGVDGADVESFFDAWSSGNCS